MCYLNKVPRLVIHIILNLFLCNSLYNIYSGAVYYTCAHSVKKLKQLLKITIQLMNVSVTAVIHRSAILGDGGPLDECY